jgi:hypothetical protein
MERTFVHNLAYSAFALACGLLTGIGVYMSGGPNYCPFIFAGLFGFSFLGLLVTWQPEPRYPNLNRSFELLIPMDNPRQLKRNAVKFTPYEMAYLKEEAANIVASEWKFTARSFDDYGYWRKRFLFWRWAYDENPRRENSTIAFTGGGKAWLRRFAGLPTPPGKMRPILHEIPQHTHQGD